MKAKKEENGGFDFAEYGASFDRSETYLAVRGFRLNVNGGPPQSIPAGARVRLGPRSAATLFLAGKIEPVMMPTVFKVIHRFVVGGSGKWEELSPGDMVKFEKAEALEYWRKGWIKPEKEEANEAEGCSKFLVQR